MLSMLVSFIRGTCTLNGAMSHSGTRVSFFLSISRLLAGYVVCRRLCVLLQGKSQPMVSIYCVQINFKTDIPSWFRVLFAIINGLNVTVT